MRFHGGFGAHFGPPYDRSREFESSCRKRFAPEIWLKEEWLCYDRPVTGQPGVKVLLRLDETTFEPVRKKFQEMHVQPMGSDHPAAWTREAEGGRFFYTAIGHDARVFNTDFGRQHLLASLQWAAGETE